MFIFIKVPFLKDFCDFFQLDSVDYFFNKINFYICNFNVCKL